MKPIEARNQVNLGLAKCVRLALTGMSYRMFRSLVTIAILALAVAFLVHMLAYGLVANQVELAAYRELQSDRDKAQAITRLSKADPLPVIVSQLAIGEEHRMEEYRNWADESFDLKAAQATAKQLTEAQAYIEGLPPAERAALTGGLAGYDLLAELALRDNLDRFMKRLASAKLQPPLGDADAFVALLRDQWPVLIDTARSIRAGHVQAIRSVNNALAGASANEVMAEQSQEVAKAARDAGFRFGNQTPQALAAYSAEVQDQQKVEKVLRNSRVRAEAAAELDVEITDVSSDLILGETQSLDRARWLAERMKRVDAEVALSPERILEIATSYQRRARLSNAVGERVPVADEGFMGLPTRTLWLIGLSFLVCVVGVANAMLMSVTERFTEIATMKCLGAMDNFVMLMFVFEAAIQGVIGGIVGVVVGLVLALLRGLVDYGGLLTLASHAVVDVLIAAVVALVVGLLLATFAAVGPSWVAARLAPMEAMRVE